MAKTMANGESFWGQQLSAAVSSCSGGSWRFLSDYIVTNTHTPIYVYLRMRTSGISKVCKYERSIQIFCSFAVDRFFCAALNVLMTLLLMITRSDIDCAHACCALCVVLCVVKWVAVALDCRTTARCMRFCLRNYENLAGKSTIIVEMIATMNVGNIGA